jgi:hypothetical protein
MERTISDHIHSNKGELDNPSLNPQRRRHLEGELSSLEKYRQNHPNSITDPSPLELYCDEHPEALECRMYNV